MVLRSAFVAAVCGGLLALAGAAEARPDRARAAADPPNSPKPPARKIHVAKTHVAKIHVEKPRAEPPRAAVHNARVKLARRHGNPLDAQAADTRIQTWPCRSG